MMTAFERFKYDKPRIADVDLDETAQLRLYEECTRFFDDLEEGELSKALRPGKLTVV